MIHQESKLAPIETGCTNSGTSTKNGRTGLGTQIFSGLILFDFAFIGIPLLFLTPLFKAARLPFRIDVFGMAGAYWAGTLSSGAFGAILLTLICCSPKVTVRPWLARHNAQKGRIAITVILAAVLILLLGPREGSIITIISFGVTELLERRRDTFAAALADVVVPAFYLFIGMALVFSYNHALAGIRNPQTYDAFLDHLDATLFHANASRIAHWSLSHLPLGYFRVLESVYYGLFAQLSALIVLMALLRDRKYSIKYVRTILVCYAIALVVYSILPAKGPYSTCPFHLSSYPRSLITYWTQDGLATRAHMLWVHNLTPGVIDVVSQDYFISFPSLHVALPIIALWFIRPWKRIAYLLLAGYVFLMLPAILLLEWHYVVDFFGGFAAASLAIWLTEQISEASVLGDARVRLLTRRFAWWSAPAPIRQPE